MSELLSALIVGVALSGCTLSKGGLGHAEPAPHANQVADILVIGAAGPFRTIADEDRDSYYRAYVHFLEQSHPGVPPRMDAAAFQEKLGGWALIMSSHIRALVPSTLAHSTRFGTAGDLVVARTDQDGTLWFERVLCSDDRSYSACAEKYQSGIFDENTGQELGHDRKPKPDGALVDVTSYLRLSPDPARHAARELDMRTAGHCDCNDARPGSIQSAVPAPQLNEPK
jgi:hypothetical protein